MIFTLILVLLSSGFLLYFGAKTRSFSFRSFFKVSIIIALLSFIFLVLGIFECSFADRALQQEFERTQDPRIRETLCRDAGNALWIIFGFPFMALFFFLFWIFGIFCGKCQQRFFPSPSFATQKPTADATPSG